MAAIMAASVAGSMTAWGADKETKDTRLTYRVTECFEWSVPVQIDFEADQGPKTVFANRPEDAKLRVEKNVIASNKRLIITASGCGNNGEFMMKNDQDERLFFKIGIGDNEYSGPTTLLEVEPGTNTACLPLRCMLTTTDKTAEIAGEYIGFITYVAQAVTIDS